VNRRPARDVGAEQAGPRDVECEDSAGPGSFDADLEDLAIVGQHDAVATVAVGIRVGDRRLTTGLGVTDERLARFERYAAVIATLTLDNNILSNTIGGGDFYNTVGMLGNNAKQANVAGSSNLVQKPELPGDIPAGVITVVGGDPGLGALQNNGGPTPTMAISRTSPASAGATSTSQTFPLPTRPADRASSTAGWTWARSSTRTPCHLPRGNGARDFLPL
jgi:hypothetical protein